MSSQASFVAFILDQLSSCGAVRAHKMFGEYALYLDETMFALVCDDALFIKPTAAARAMLGTVTEAPPFPVAKPWFLIDAALLEDPAQLCALAQCTAAALPLPKKKTKKRTS